MTPAQWTVLKHLAIAGERPAGDIHPATYRTLVGLGLIEDCPVYFGPRSHCVRVTAKGRDVIEKNRSRRHAARLGDRGDTGTGPGLGPGDGDGDRSGYGFTWAL
jgi:hypothetical protein